MTTIFPNMTIRLISMMNFHKILRFNNLVITRGIDKYLD